MFARIAAVLALAAGAMAAPTANIPLFALARNPDYTPPPYQIPIRSHDPEPYEAPEDRPVQEIYTEPQRLPVPATYVAQQPYQTEQRYPDVRHRSSAPAYGPGSTDEGPAQYHFTYGIKDDYSGNDFGHQEARDGYKTEGNYYVQLPDGRLQQVEYTVDGDSGYVAEVSYEGEAKHPEYIPAPAYTPAPSYQSPRSYQPAYTFRSLNIPPVRYSSPLYF
ncbi:cuticle protein 21 [Penaeus vannamei]|uniref:cuticle protein 21 n=1 Tax=Penaeus vannamei TaxID=6689 RepID=UPI00387F7ECD